MSEESLATVATLAILSFVVILFVVGGLWLAFQKSRRDRQQQRKERSDHPQLPLPDPPLLEGPTRELEIRWGEPSAIEDGSGYNLTQSTMIRWGPVETVDSVPGAGNRTNAIGWGEELRGDGSPTDFENFSKCPLCRQSASRDVPASFICECGVVYHRSCLVEYSQCPNCRRAL